MKVRLLFSPKREKTAFASWWARRKTLYLCYIHPLLTKGAYDRINPSQAYRIYKKMDDHNPGKCICLIAWLPHFLINDFNTVIKPFLLKCTTIKQTYLPLRLHNYSCLRNHFQYVNVATIPVLLLWKPFLGAWNARQKHIWTYITL